MKIEVLADAAEVSNRGAALIAAAAREAIDARGRFIMAVSGGNTPWEMLRALAAESIDWNKVHIVQVDERLAPLGSPDRNLTHLQSALLARALLSPDHIHPMPLEKAQLAAAAANYANTLERLAGAPPVLDLVELGLGFDGHTASLVPGDPVLDVTNADVAVTGVYEGRRRMTLTFPVINRARCVLWVVTGSAKAEVLARFRAGDVTLPACRVNRERAVLLTDRAAAGLGAA